MNPEKPWWQTTSIYQIYPRSFMDSNNDGIGDLNGIISRLDYIQDLGFETLWISPFFCSPQQDFGYDISDYTDIAPEYGSLADVEHLIKEIHARGIRVIFDLVLNHTSIQHPWFQEARSSRDSARRDWYIWRDGRGKRPPNNWSSIPGGSGWQYDPSTDQYYYASFLPFQPDLNWRNPRVRQAMFNVVRFWLDRGVDGFRLDIFHTIFKDAYFRDNPFSIQYIPKDDRVGFFQKWQYTLNQPEVFQLAKDLRALVDSYSPQRLLVGEVFGSDDNLKQILGEQQDGLHLVFLWELLNLKGKAGFLRDVIRHYERHYPPPFIPVYVFGNHDRKRVISHIGGNPRIANLLALFQFTVRGVPVTYYGEEIGMAENNLPVKNALDPIGQQYRRVPRFLADLFGLYVNRDGCRTPMQWEDGPNAGFSGPGSVPWLPVNSNHKKVNVRSQQIDVESTLNAYKAVLKLRKENPALQYGDLEMINEPQIGNDLLVYQRKSLEQTLLVAMNFGKRPEIIKISRPDSAIILVIGAEPARDSTRIQLPPLTGVVVGDP